MKSNVALLIVVFGVLACDYPHQSEGLSTPEGSLYQTCKALSELDAGKVLNSVTGSPEELRALSAHLDFFISIKKFKAAIVREYGESEWAHFEDESGSVLTYELEFDLDAIRDLRIETSGDTATVIDSGMILHRKDGSWHLNAKDLFNSEVDAEGWIELSELIKTKSAKIGQKNVTAKALDLEIGEEMVPITLRSKWDVFIDTEVGISGNPLSWIVKEDYECIVRIEDNGEVVDSQIPTQGPQVDMKIKKNALFVNGAGPFDLKPGRGGWVNGVKFKKDLWQRLWHRRNAETGWKAEILVRRLQE